MYRILQFAMNSSLLVITICLIQLIYGNNNDIRDYLRLQRHEVNEGLQFEVKEAANNTVRNCTVTSKAYFTLPRHYTNIRSFVMSNITYVSLDSYLYEMLENRSSPVDNFPPLLKQFQQQKQNEKINCIEAIDGANVSFILIGTNDSAQIFKKIQSNFGLIQTIDTVHLKNAKFFYQKSNLYLIILNDKSDVTSYSMLYKYERGNFNQIVKFPTSGASKAVIFGNNIAILQHSDHKKVPSLLYRLKSDNLILVQKFKTNNPTELIIFNTTSGTTQFIILNGRNKLEQYIWTGSNLFLLNKINWDFDVNEMLAININQYPIVIVSTNDGLSLLDLNSGARLINFFNSCPECDKVQLIYNGSNLFIIKSRANSTEINLLTINNCKMSNRSVDVEDKDDVMTCLNHLEQIVYNLRVKTETIKNQVSAEPRNVENLNISAANVNTTLKFNEVQNGKRLENLNQLYQGLLSQLDLEKPEIASLKDNVEHKVINDTGRLNISLKAKKMSAINIKPKRINGKLWSPEELLTKLRAGLITGKVKTKRLDVKNLIVKNSTLFNDLIFNNTEQSQIMSGLVRVNTMNISNLNVESINGIAVENIYKKGQETITVSGAKTFRDLQIVNAEINNINGINSDAIITSFTNAQMAGYEFNSPVVIKNVTAKTVNGIDIEQFKTSVFRLGISDTIEGNLFLAGIEINNGKFNSVGNTNVDDLFTTSGDQEINSRFQMNEIVVPSLELEHLNGLKFHKSVAIFNDTIESPVKIDNINIKNDLIMHKKLERDYLILNKDHIVGTNESDLYQNYKGTVTIKGNLYLTNLTISNPIRLNGSRLKEDFFNQFWSKTASQTIPSHFEALQGISTSHLNTRTINNFNVTSFMINNDGEFLPQFTKFHFHNTIIDGNLSLDNSKNHTPNLWEISRNAVRTIGRYEIKGQKIYRNTLKINNLNVDKLQGVSVNDALFTGNNTISGAKYFRTVRVLGNLLANNISCNIINNVDINRLKQDSVYLDNNEDLSQLHFQQISVDNLHVSKLNNVDVNEFILILDKLYKTMKFNSVYVGKDVEIKIVQNVSTINDKLISDMIKNNVRYLEKWQKGILVGRPIALQFKSPVNSFIDRL